MTKEQKFYNALKDIFVGEEVEGESGYINLMRIKSRYYERGVFPRLRKDIESALKPFPEFREELFDKLYTFFESYFSESGSIYFRYTPLHKNIYERVYTDDRDVMLFWKTHMLYYVKTDRLFKSLEVEIDGYKFFFDVSSLEYKKANEKRDIIYEFKEKRKDGVLVFNVLYSEKGKTTKVDEILKSLKEERVEIDGDVLERAFRVFERQSEVDYFINKNAKEFLRGQFEMWFYQYIFKGESEWTEKRIKQLQVLKDIAFKIIDFISQFEDELVKIWNKPKFVLNSNYVITLDRIAERDKELKLMEKILKHANFIEQEKEWKELGIVDDSFRVEDIIKDSPFLKGWHSEGMTGELKLPYNPNLKEKARELRKAGNLSEVLLWDHLKQKKMLGFDFTRQQVIGDYIVDFYCPKLRLVIEIDGESHDFKGEYDEEKDRYLQSLGLTVLHFKDKDIKHSLNEVLIQIEGWIKNSPFYKRSTREAGEVLNTPSASQTPLLEKGELNPKYKHLPIDTKYFKDLELEILGLFDDLDNSLDGWLIKSENYQALNTILPKFKEKVQTIYIDPPYNTGSDEFIYKDKFQHSSWLTMMENRLKLAKEVLKENGIIFVSIGDTTKTDTHITSTSKLTTLMNEIFSEDNYVATFVRKSGIAPRQDIKHIANTHDYIVSYAKKIDLLKLNQKPASLKEFVYEDKYVAIRGKYRLNKLDRGSIHYSESLDYPIIAPDGTEIWPGGDPEDKRWIWRWSKDKVKWGIENDYIVFKKDTEGNWKVYYKEYKLVDNQGKPRQRMNPYDTFIMEVYNEIGNGEIENLFGGRVFEYPKPTNLILHLLKIGSFADSLILDFFAGSGTTAHAVMKLNKEDGGKRKFILVEMADYFETIIIPRLKKIAYSFNWKDGKPQDNDGIGIFFKYYELEQYEDTLRRVKYDDSDLFDNPYQDPYNQYVFMRDLKMLSALEVDYENNKVKVDLSRLYPNTPSHSPSQKGCQAKPDGVVADTPLGKGNTPSADADTPLEKGNIDIAETLSNLLGKWIKRIISDYVEFEDGERVDLKNLDYKLIKPLIWW